jgi:hypothetical protein
MHYLKDEIKVVKRSSRKSARREEQNMIKALPIPDPTHFDEYTLWLQNQQMSINTITNYLIGLRHIVSNAETIESYFADPTLKAKKCVFIPNDPM